MALSDEITTFIRDVLMNGDGVAELQRGEVAGRFHCAPSQINYVIATRFAPEQGYLIESRRGGGGYIRITRVHSDKQSLLMHAMSVVGPWLDARTAAVMTQNLRHTEALTDEQTALLLTATSDNALRPIPKPQRDAARAAIFKQLVLVIMKRS